MKSVRTTLAFAAAWSILAFGTLALLNPLVAVRLVGLEIVEPRGWSDFRATYGAMWVVMGAALLWAIPTRPRSIGWVRLTAAMWTAAAAARIASVVLDGVWTPVNVAVTAAYVVVALALGLASFQKIPERPPVRVRPDSAPGAPRARSLPRWGRPRATTSGTPDAVSSAAATHVAHARPGGAPQERDDDAHLDDDRAVPPPPLWGGVDPPTTPTTPTDSDPTPTDGDDEVKTS